MLTLLPFVVSFILCIVVLVIDCLSGMREKKPWTKSKHLVLVLVASISFVLQVNEVQSSKREISAREEEYNKLAVVRGGLEATNVKLIEVIEVLKKSVAPITKTNAFEEINKIWFAEPLVVRKSNTLSGASGRRVSGSITVGKGQDDNKGRPTAKLEIYAKCSSNNFIIGAKGVVRVRIGDKLLSSLKVDCGAGGADSATATILLPYESLVQFKPSDLSLSPDYR